MSAAGGHADVSHPLPRPRPRAAAVGPAPCPGLFIPGVGPECRSEFGDGELAAGVGLPRRGLVC